MRIEHLAFNVADPVKIAEWYTRHLGWTVWRSDEKPPYGRFLADSAGGVMVEFYHNTAALVPDYAAMDPLVVHIGLVCPADVEAERVRLMEAGATDAGGIIVTPLGDRLAMLRDPWGLPLQLCHRRR